MLAELRTFAVKVLNETGSQNRRAKLEEFSDDFEELIKTLKKLKFL